MYNICCTIVSTSHIYKGITLLKSLQAYDNYSTLLYLIVMEPVDFKLDNINILNIDHFLKSDEDAIKMADKYKDDELRWSIKSVVIRYLVNNYQEANVLYCDCDMFFFDYPTHLFNYLEEGGIVLTPHWRPLNPETDLVQFRANFINGLFNAGCIAANTAGIPALNWWVQACISGCERNFMQGLWFDQAYLDLMPIYFSQTVICRHFGYNVAYWNSHLRNEYLDGTKTLKDFFSIILAHFTKDTILSIESGADTLLEPYLDKYKKSIKNSLKLLVEVRNNQKLQ